MNKQINAGIVLQYIQMFLSIAIGVIYTPIMLRLLGQSEYGLYNLAASIISYLSLLTLSFGASYVRFFTLYKKNNPEKINKLNGLYLTTFFLISLVALIAGTVLSSNVRLFLNNTYSIKDIGIAKNLMILLTINLAISFPMSVFTSFITAHERFIFLKISNIGKTVFSPALSIIALFFGYGSIGVVIATTAINLLVDAINIYYCFSKLKMRFSFRKMEFYKLKEIFVFSVFIAMNQLIDQINWQTDKIILGKMISSAAVSIYAIGASINMYYVQFSSAISNLYGPKINQIVVRNDKEMNVELTHLMTNVGMFQFFLLFLILTGFIFFGEYFIMIWAGTGYKESFYVALFLMIPETIPLIQNIGIEIQRAKNKHKFRSIIYLIMALVNVGISIFLCFLYGVVGVAVGTTISILIANVIIMNIYYHRRLNIDMFYFWKSIIKMLPLFIVPLLIGIMIKEFCPIKNLFDFVRQIIGYVCVYLICSLPFILRKR